MQGNINNLVFRNVILKLTHHTQGVGACWMELLSQQSVILLFSE